MAARSTLLIALLTALLPGALFAQANGDVLAASEPVLRPGDSLRVAVWRKPELSGSFAVRSDGSIGDPFYSDVKVAGLSLADAEERVRRHVGRFESEPRVLLEPRFRVAVGGEVRQPGLYTFGPETTVLQALMLAGGATERGQLERVVLVRDGRELRLDLTRSDAPLATQPVRSGDQLVVTRRKSFFREFIVPTATITGAAAAVLNALRRD